MAALTVRVEGLKEMQAAFKRMNPGTNPRITPAILEELAVPVLRNAKDKQIAAGGRGKKSALPPLPHMLTSRTGHLRRSIHINKGPLPRAIEVGTDEVYGAVHEFHPTRPRPFLAPALAAVSPRFGAIVVREWRKQARL